MKKCFVIILLIILFVTGCTQNAEVIGDRIQIKDVLGRKVEVKSKVERVIAIGPGALRLYTMVGDTDKLIGIEQIEIDNNTGRPYNIANPELQELEVIGLGGPNNQPDLEKLIEMKPDLVFSMYTTDVSAVDMLESRTNIPVVALSYGIEPPYDENIYKSLDIIGRVMNNTDRSEEVIEFIKSTEKDLNNRTKEVNKKPKVYVGALSYKGIHGIESTAGSYAILDVVNGYNIVDELGKSGSIMIDKEKLIEWNPEKIIIDMAGKDLVLEEYLNNKNFYKNIDAFKNGEIYMQLPFNYYNTNIGTAIANAYFIGKSVYPESFTDLEPEEKADEIYNFLYGGKAYSKMTEDFGKFDKLRLK